MLDLNLAAHPYEPAWRLKCGLEVHPHALVSITQFKCKQNVYRLCLFLLYIGQCEDPGLPENGRRIIVPPMANNFTTGTRVYFTCSDGYEIAGTNTRLCRDNGTWTSTTPECRLANSKMDEALVVIYTSANLS